MRIPNFEAIEKYLFEVLSWVVFFPRTIYVSLLPGWPSKYLRKHNGGENKEYIDIVSPKVFLFISSIVKVFTIYIVASNSDIFRFPYQLILADLWGSLFVFVLALQIVIPFFGSLFIWLPESLIAVSRKYSIGIIPFSKKRLEMHFDTQCLIFGSLYILFSITSLLSHTYFSNFVSDWEHFSTSIILGIPLIIFMFLYVAFLLYPIVLQYHVYLETLGDWAGEPSDPLALLVSLSGIAVLAITTEFAFFLGLPT